MKLTRKKLIKVVEETIKEVSSSIGSRGARKRHQKNQTAQADAEAARQAASSAHKERETQKTAAKAARDTANQQHKAHLATEPKVDGRTKRGALGVSIGSSAKYYYTHRGNRYYSSTNNINQLPLQYRKAGWQTDIDYTTWENQKNKFTNTKDTKTAAYNAASDAADATQKAFTDAEAEEKKAKDAAKQSEKQKNFGFHGAKGGGLASVGKKGKGKKGKGKKGKKGKNDESLFRILGRDLIKEIKNQKKYN